MVGDSWPLWKVELYKHVDRCVVVLKQNDYKLLTRISKAKCERKRRRGKKWQIPPAPVSNL